MHLTGLELIGFKSFSKKTRLTFTPGLTCVVGPNGSGKSAIADAIRWVLGEQSLKSIRAKKGEDVIFAGSRSHARLGAAEVSLTFAEAEAAGLDTAELSLTRRIDRSGESAYLVNGRPVRLFDLAELLARAGFAQKSYTVIPQGMIESLITASPAERRQMFEDATGVTPLLLKQDHAERKLAATRAEVARAKDLLRELEPRLRNLKRLANRARSRTAIERELKSAEEQWAATRWHALTTDLTRLQAARAAAEARRVESAEALARLRAQGAPTPQNLARLPGLRAELERAHAEERDLLVARGRAEATGSDDVDRVAEEITAREKEREKLLHAASEVAGNQATVRSDLARASRDLAALEAAAAGNNGESVPDTTQARAVAGALAEVRAVLARARAASNLPDVRAALDELDASVTRLAELLPAGALLPKLPSLLRAERAAHERLLTLVGKEAQLRERIRSVEERLSDLHRRPASGSRATARPTDLARRLATVQRTAESLRQTIAKLEDDLVAAAAAREKAAVEERALRATHEAIEEERARRAAEEAAVAARRDDLVREVTERRRGDFVSRLKRGAVPAVSGANADALRTEIERLQKKLFEVGGIDPTVLAEESALEKRVTELRTGVADLEAAEKNLRGTLRELAGHIQDRFAAGFRAMGESFQRYFREIFGGGRASLSLARPPLIAHAFGDLPTELADWEGTSEAETGPHVHELPAGVEIHVHPPGKKLGSLAQLSGGEKALASIALLFAVLEHRSSPFVVLDEVDAALDEANSVRFARLLKRTAERTQLIVITHNRATMEVARALYGVTMGEDGVSRLLSVKLEDAPAAVSEGHASSPRQ